MADAVPALASLRCPTQLRFQRIEMDLLSVLICWLLSATRFCVLVNCCCVCAGILSPDFQFARIAGRTSLPDFAFCLSY